MDRSSILRASTIVYTKARTSRMECPGLSDLYDLHPQISGALGPYFGYLRPE